MRITDTHVYFFAPSDIFSNHYEYSFIYEGIEFKHIEQFMMYKKAILFKDFEIAIQILKTDSPRECKKLGRNVKQFSEEIWNVYKYDIVKEGCKQKFLEEPLKSELLQHKNKKLVEASPYDLVWGVGLSEDDDNILDEANWCGENLLGIILTELTQELLMENNKKVRRV